MVADKATSLRRGLELVLALGEQEAGGAGGVGVVRLARLVGVDKSQASRSLKILAEYGLVERDAETRAYRLGGRLLALAARAGEPRLVAAAPRVLADLVERLGESAHLTVLAGPEVLTLQSHAPAHAVQAAGWVGRTVPAHCTSAGRALLLDRDRDELAALLGRSEFPPLGPNAARDVGELHARIVEARERGYAVADEEFERGLVAVAAPVRSFEGRIVAALDVSGPKFRFAERLPEAGRAVGAAAGDLSRALGWRA
jgi:DNA-binding IclR family transcriptional regulator